MSADELSAVEKTKIASDFLRGRITEQLEDGTDGFGADEKNLIKFHGMYQQKDRDLKKDEAGKRIESPQAVMLRCRIPGGRMSSEQYLAADHLASEYAGGTLRLTTRQTIQFHTIPKVNLRKLIAGLAGVGLSSRGACGDVVRNVILPPDPLGDPQLGALEQVVRNLSDHFLFKTSAYGEIWLGEERRKDEEPFYGATYLPRKFKIGVTVAGNNAIDILSNDLGFAATFRGNEIEGFFVTAGGGMGMQFNKPGTFPRLADCLGWIPAPVIGSVAEAVVSIHRDFGDRRDRHHARLKYIIADRGLEWMKDETARRSGTPWENRPMPEWRMPRVLGWFERPDGTLALGLLISCGRILDRADFPLKTVLRKIVEDIRPSIQMTPDQNMLLTGINPARRGEIDERLRGLGVAPGEYGTTVERSEACVALPTCPLAFTESERVLPKLAREIEEKVDALGLSDRAPVIRMTGCPNGCARPYNAEIGIVGERAGLLYALYIGGAEDGTRLAKKCTSLTPLAEIPARLGRLLEAWATESRAGGERLGDFADRIGMERVEGLLK